MSALPPIMAISAVGNLAPDHSPVAVGAISAEVTSFAHLLETGVEHVNKKLVGAESLSKSFALDDSVPVQQVTYALQEARLSLELMLQVRTRLLEAYQQFAQMQL